MKQPAQASKKVETPANADPEAEPRAKRPRKAKEPKLPHEKGRRSKYQSGKASSSTIELLTKRFSDPMVDITWEAEVEIDPSAPGAGAGAKVDDISTKCAAVGSDPHNNHKQTATVEQSGMRTSATQSTSKVEVTTLRAAPAAIPVVNPTFHYTAVTAASSVAAAATTALPSFAAFKEKPSPLRPRVSPRKQFSPRRSPEKQPPSASAISSPTKRNLKNLLQMVETKTASQSHSDILMSEGTATAAATIDSPSKPIDTQSCEQSTAVDSSPVKSPTSSQAAVVGGEVANSWDVAAGTDSGAMETSTDDTPVGKYPLLSATLTAFSLFVSIIGTCFQIECECPH